MSTKDEAPEGAAPAPGTLRLDAAAPSSLGDLDTIDSRRGKEVADVVLAAAFEVRPGDYIDGRYRLTHLLGKGGMGRVFAAEHTELGKWVAVKLMDARLAHDPDYLRRFRREARAASSIDHPNVVRILDFGTYGGQPFLVMELVEGESLDKWIAQHARHSSIGAVVEIGVQILSALEVLHAAGIVHRDLKPANIVLGTDAFGAPAIKVLDLGLAHFEDATDRGPTLTQFDVVAGTPEYMSPEQSRSLRVGPGSDLYAFGCILTELLQGKPPFLGQSAMDVLSQHLYAPPPALERERGAEPVPATLERLRLDLLAKHASRRPPSASEARARLLETIDRQSLASEMSKRRSSAPPALRADRIPHWNDRGASGSDGPDAHAVACPPIIVIRLQELDGGLDQTCLTGLQLLGFETATRTATDAGADMDSALSDASSGSDAASDATALDAAAEPTAAEPIYVLDVGAAKRDGRDWLRRVCARSAPPDVLICAAELGADEVGAWIEAGATDTAPYPVASDELARRLLRLARRRSRHRRRSLTPSG